MIKQLTNRKVIHLKKEPKIVPLYPEDENVTYELAYHIKKTLIKEELEYLKKLEQEENEGS